MLNKPLDINSLAISTIIVILAFIFLGLYGASIGWSIITSLTIYMLLLYSQHDINKIFQLFKLLFIISLIPSMILWILHIIGVDITSLAISIQEAPNAIKTEAGQYYLIFPGASTLNYMLNSPILRLQGMYDEPGVIGTIGGLILIADQMDLKKKSNIIIFIAGVMSLSLAFYIIIAIYYLMYFKKYYKYLLGASTVVLFIFISLPSSKQQFIADKTINKIEITDDLSIKGRDTIDSSNWYDWKNSYTKEFLFGLTNAPSDGSSSYKNVFIKTGYIGMLLVFMIYSLILFKNTEQFTCYHFVFIFILSFLQRPYIITPYHILIFIYAMQIRNLNNENITHNQ